MHYDATKQLQTERWPSSVLVSFGNMILVIHDFIRLKSFPPLTSVSLLGLITPLCWVRNFIQYFFICLNLIYAFLHRFTRKSWWIAGTMILALWNVIWALFLYCFGLYLLGAAHSYTILSNYATGFGSWLESRQHLKKTAFWTLILHHLFPLFPYWSEQQTFCYQFRLLWSNAVSFVVQYYIKIGGLS